VTYAGQLLASLRAGMIVLLDRNFAAAALIASIAGTEADVLSGSRTAASCRCCTAIRRLLPVPAGRDPDPRHRLRDHHLHPRRHRTGIYRLATTLLDHRRYPASELVRLYHERWEIETAYLEIKSTILGGRVLRARTPAGIDQEIYALLVTYQILRTAMADATAGQPGTDPDRASFTIALHAAPTSSSRPPASSRHRHRPDRDHRPPRPGQPHARPPRPHQPPHRQASDFKYVAKGPGINRTSYKATIAVNILTSPGP